MATVIILIGIIAICFLLFKNTTVDISPAEILVYNYMKIISSSSEGKEPSEEYQRISIQSKLIVCSGFHNGKYIIAKTFMENGTRIYECNSLQNEKYVIMIGRGAIMTSILYQGGKSGLAFSNDPAPLLFI